MKEWLESLAAWAQEQGLSLLEALDVAESEGHIGPEDKSFLYQQSQRLLGWAEENLPHWWYGEAPTLEEGVPGLLASEQQVEDFQNWWSQLWETKPEREERLNPKPDAPQYPGRHPDVPKETGIADKVEVSLDESSYLNQAMLAALGQAMHGKTGTPAPVSLGGPSAGWGDPFSAGYGEAKDYTYIGSLS